MIFEYFLRKYEESKKQLNYLEKQKSLFNAENIAQVFKS